MSTNVYCDLCEKEVATDDSFVVETPDIVRAYHFECGEQIQAALGKARGRSNLVLDYWEFRELKDQVAALEDVTRRVTSVWRLWLNDAKKGAISPGTFNAMQSLLGGEDEA